MNRRHFIQNTLAITGLASIVASCTPKKKIKGKIIGASASIGHLMRNNKFGPPVEVSQKEVVIIGGGISGLSAAYHLQKMGIRDFSL